MGGEEEVVVKSLGREVNWYIVVYIRRDIVF